MRYRAELVVITTTTHSCYGNLFCPVVVVIEIKGQQQSRGFPADRRAGMAAVKVHSCRWNMEPTRKKTCNQVIKKKKIIRLVLATR